MPNRQPPLATLSNSGGELSVRTLSVHFDGDGLVDLTFLEFLELRSFNFCRGNNISYPQHCTEQIHPNGEKGVVRQGGDTTGIHFDWVLDFSLSECGDCDGEN